MMNKRLVRVPLIMAVAALTLTTINAQAGTMNASSAQAAAARSVAVGTPSLNIKRAQQIMVRLGLPAGKPDGRWGEQSDRGACAFRYLMTPAKKPYRGKLTSAEYNILWKFRNSSLGTIRAPRVSGKATYLLVHQTCQTMFYVKNGRYNRVFAASTGTRAHPTPNSTYTLQPVVSRRLCSRMYPKVCLYKPREFRRGYFLSGAANISTAPTTHGGVFVSEPDADWLHKYANVKLSFVVTGRF